MALATISPGGILKTLNDKCMIKIGNYTINMRILPSIADGKRASFVDTVIPGRSTPIKSYSHSESRVITMKLPFIVVTAEDYITNVNHLRAIASATYPQEGTPYIPPPVCTIQCGLMLGSKPLCCLLEGYSVDVPTNVTWHKDYLIPCYFEVSTTWQVVYSTYGNSQLPNASTILGSGN